MKEKPIIFSTEMVKAILDGKKTQTRRIVKAEMPIGVRWFGVVGDELCYRIVDQRSVNVLCKNPYGEIGDRLWIRESWCYYLSKVIYKADKVPNNLFKWKPSIHLKRKDVRLFLEITNIRIERLQDISEEDCQAEGIKWQWNGNCEDCFQWSVSGDKSNEKVWFDYAEDCFKDLWDSINSKRGSGWDTNPWVWVIEFKRAY